MTVPMASIDKKPAFGLTPAKVLNTPLGAASPLWFAFVGAAGAGVAYWWMTRWMKPFNVEALIAKAKPLQIKKVAAEPVAAPPVVESAPAPVLEAVAEDAPVVDVVAEETPAPAAAVIAEPEPAVVEEPVVAAPVIAETVAEAVAPAPAAPPKAKAAAKAATKAATPAASTAPKTRRTAPKSGPARRS